MAGLPEKSPQTEIPAEKSTHVQVTELPDSGEINNTENLTEKVTKQQQEDELTPQLELPDQKSLIKMTEFTLPDSEKGPQELTPVQDLPEKISYIELTKAEIEKCSTPEAKLSDSETSKQELTPMRDIPEIPSQIKMTSSQDIVS